MADAFGEDPYGCTVRQLGNHGLKDIPVLAHRGGVVLPTVDRNGTGRLHHPSNPRMREERRFGQESNTAPGNTRHYYGVDKGILMVRYRQNGATGWHA